MLIDFANFDGEILEVGSLVVSVSSALVTIFATLEQVSSSARARSNIDWILKSLEEKAHGVNPDALKKQLVRSQARLMARQEVPLRYFLPAVVWALIIAAVLYTESGDRSSIPSLLSSVLGAGGLGLYMVKMTIRAYCERVRIEYQLSSEKYKYRQAEIDFTSLIAAGSRKEFFQSFILVIGVCLSATSITVIQFSGLNFWRFAFLLASFGTVAITCLFVFDYARELAGDPAPSMPPYTKRRIHRKQVKELIGVKNKAEIRRIGSKLRAAESIKEEILARVHNSKANELGDILSASLKELGVEASSIFDELEKLRVETKDATSTKLISPKLEKRVADLEDRIQRCKRVVSDVQLGEGED